MNKSIPPSEPVRPAQPLAERMRPQTLDEMVGQTELLGASGVLRRLIVAGRMPSAIFWGDPGTGKTTLARIIARTCQGDLYELSAVSAGVADVRRVIDAGIANRHLHRPTLLFIDEIHRFNKAQQDALLHAVEDGTLVLLGATTENPSFEVIGPLLSRCRVFHLQPLTPDEITILLERAASTDPYLAELGVTLDPDAKVELAERSGGDARTALNALEVAVELAAPQRRITLPIVQRAMLARPGRYDKAGEYHYDVISAFIKSLRGSDPDAALYWLARMLEAGEDPLFIARRMVILASEDIGNANPTALVLAVACAEAVHFVGMPEAALNLAQTATYLAASPKSNAAYRGLIAATQDVRQNPERPVPLHLRNAVTGLMRAMGYGRDYRYPHDYEDGFVDQNYMPEGLEDRTYYRPTDRGAEKTIKERLDARLKHKGKPKDA